MNQSSGLWFLGNSEILGNPIKSCPTSPRLRIPSKHYKVREPDPRSEKQTSEPLLTAQRLVGTATISQKGWLHRMVLRDSVIGKKGRDELQHRARPTTTKHTKRLDELGAPNISRDARIPSEQGFQTTLYVRLCSTSQMGSTPRISDSFGLGTAQYFIFHNKF